MGVDKVESKLPCCSLVIQHKTKISKVFKTGQMQAWDWYIHLPHTHIILITHTYTYMQLLHPYILMVGYTNSIVHKIANSDNGVLWKNIRHKIFSLYCFIIIYTSSTDPL